VNPPIRLKERDSLIQALRAGVVPRAGQHLIQVGRLKEIEGILKDIDRIADGGTSFRLIIGEYGSGKTFFLNLIRSIALERKLVTASADLNPDRRIHATGGQARSLYSELTRNISTRTKPDGGALPGIVEKFIFTATTEAKIQNVSVDAVIHAKLDRLSELVNGYDFAQVIGIYWRAHTEGNQDLKNSAIRWLRGEYTTKTEARSALGVRTIVDDASVYDQLKLLGIFVRLAGFSGLLVCLDELVNLYKLSNTQARRSNYEQLLRIVNDMLQGTTEGLGFILGGTPDFLMNTQRGLYSYSALQSRLAENTFAKNANVVDYDHPVLHLASLSQEEFVLLLGNILNVFASGDDSRFLLPEEGVFAFMSHCHQRIGEAYFRTPRTTITAFVNLLSLLEQNPDMNWQNLLGQVEIIRDTSAIADLPADELSTPDLSVASALNLPHISPDDEFTRFKL
jgi:hypothetical protein